MPPPCPYIDPKARGTLPSCMQPYDSAAGHIPKQQQEPHRYMRHDSPMESRKPALDYTSESHMQSLRPALNYTSESTMQSRRPVLDYTSNLQPDHDISQPFVALPAWQLLHPSAVPRRPIMTDTPANSNNNTDDEANANDAFQFVTIDHPKKLKDKTQMRANRQFVMHNYLRKESQNKVRKSRDARVVADRKRPRPDPSVMAERPAVTRNTSAPSYIFDSTNLTPASSGYSTASSHGDSDEESGPRAPMSGPMLQLPPRPSSTSAVAETLYWSGFGIDQEEDLIPRGSSQDSLQAQPPSMGAPNASAERSLPDSHLGRHGDLAASASGLNTLGGQAGSNSSSDQHKSLADKVSRPYTLSDQAAPNITISEYVSPSGPRNTSPTNRRGCSGASHVHQQSLTTAPSPAPQSLIPRSSASPSQNAYLAHPITFIPEPGRARINTFNTWPQFTSPRLVVEKLKYECNRVFGSQAMAANWVPAIISAPHAFLSTICIYGAYEESFRGKSSGVERILIENEVIRMIDRCIASPVQRVSDGTVIAVVHLVSGLVMTSSQAVLREHAIGLTRMVGMRGGLGRLGVGGEMATVVTSTVLVVEVLGEVAPPEMYQRWLQTRELVPEGGGRWWPESPVFCGPGSVTRTSGRLGSVLDDVRELAECLRTSKGYDGQEERIALIAERITGAEPAVGGEDGATGEHAKNEAIRLTSQLFANAIITRRPLSAVAATHHPSPAIQIAHALERTNLDDCWGAQAGVLFWITLVAGAAAASPSATEPLASHDITAEERARKWLAAVTVRCEILLVFAHGDAVLGTLARMAEIQRLLARGSGPGARATPVVSGAARRKDVQTEGQGAFGPARSLRWT